MAEIKQKAIMWDMQKMNDYWIDKQICEWRLKTRKRRTLKKIFKLLQTEEKY